MSSRSVASLSALMAAASLLFAAPATRSEPSPAPLVVLLHGLARSDASMQRMEQALQQAGYRVCNIAYPSREHSIDELATRFVAPSIEACAPEPGEPVHFVTHSMGGILVRVLARDGLVGSIGRVVMLGPPNHGSEVVDALGDWELFDAINGPAGRELGTSPDSVPRTLGPATFETGIVAGRHTINWINSLIIPGDDDGKVSVESAKLDGMRDFLVVDVSHPFLMNDDEVIAQTLQFLAYGCFSRDGAREPADGAGACVERGRLETRVPADPG